MASRTSTSGAEFVIIIIRVRDQPTSQAGLQRFAYGQAKANGRDLLYQSLQGLYGCWVGKRCRCWFWIKYRIPPLRVNLPVEFCEVDVKLDDNGVTLPCMMVSGHLADSVEDEK